MRNSDIVRLRLVNQHIARPVFAGPEDVVGWLGAVQAQDYAGAKWALGLRLRGAVDGDIDRALADGTILRTHLLRPTWHFVTPADIRWLLALTAPRVHAANAFMYRKLELDGAVFERSHTLLAQALRDSGPLTRHELRRVLEGTGLALGEGMRLAYILMHAELEGLVCSGPRRGKQFTYALLEGRVPPTATLGHEEALAELAGRYFSSRGPATVQDFAKWSELALTQARHGLEAVRPQLVREVVEGQDYWLPASGPPATVESPAACLLSIYDEYISGYKDYRAICTAETGARLSVLGNALTHIIVIDGQIAGTWKRLLKKDVVAVQLDPFVSLAPAQSQAVAEAARRYGAFLQRPAVFA